MPNLLAAIGQATPAIRSTMTDIEERPKQALRWGLEQEQMGQTRAINQMNLEKLQAAETERKRLLEEDKEPVDIQTFPQVMDLDQATKNKLIKDLDAAGIAKNGVGERGKIRDHFKSLALDPKTFAPYIELEIEGRRTDFFAAHEQLNKEQSKKDFDPNKVSELRGKVEVASGKYKKALKKAQGNEEEQKFVNNLNSAKDTITSLKSSDDWKLLNQKEQMGLLAMAGYGGVEAMQKLFVEIIKEKKEGPIGTALTIKDPSSKTGWSYRYPNNTIVRGAPKPTSEKPEKLTESERDPDAHHFSSAITDAKKTEQTPLFMEKLSEGEQQRAEARLRNKTKSNYLARGGNPKKFDQFWTQENIYGAQKLDQSDIAKLKEFATPDEAISHIERSYRANMIDQNVREQALSLINANRKKWSNWKGSP